MASAYARPAGRATRARMFECYIVTNNRFGYIAVRDDNVVDQNVAAR